MTTMKKLVSMILAVMMLLSVCAVANAATITISGGHVNSQYSAYRILNATVDANDPEKVAYTVNEKYANAIKAAVGEENAADIVTYLNRLTATELADTAKLIYDQVKSLEADARINGNGTTEKVDTGYYLIAETAIGDKEDTFSLVMTKTAKGENTVITTKESAPELEKKVQEKNDTTGVESGWQDGADYDLNDSVPFQLTGTVSSKIDSYKTYYYEFVDTLSAGLTFNNDVKVKIGEIDVTNQFTVTHDNGNISIKCVDLKKLTGVTVNSATEVVVTYTATLNGSAVIGAEGNPNVAKLVFNNNPYFAGAGEPAEDNKGETPDDTVIVFTYELTVDKVDSNGAALAGAGFTLYKNTAGDEDAEPVWTAVGTEITGETTFNFQRLDAGQYKLVETTVPGGYNKAADLIFTIDAEYETKAADPKFIKLKVDNGALSVNGAAVETDVENRSGAELPSTGGIGTTIFYAVGGLLVVLAVVLLVTKRRVGEEN